MAEMVLTVVIGGSAAGLSFLMVSEVIANWREERRERRARLERIRAAQDDVWSVTGIW